MIAIIVSILALIVSVFAIIEASIASGTTNEVGDRISFVENMVRQHEQLFKTWGDWRDKLVLKRKRREVQYNRVVDIGEAHSMAKQEDFIRGDQWTPEQRLGGVRHQEPIICDDSSDDITPEEAAAKLSAWYGNALGRVTDIATAQEQAILDDFIREESRCD